MYQGNNNFDTFDDPEEEDPICITQRELWRHIRGQGCDISERQLERWHKEDCLPRPRRIAIAGSGMSGSSWGYPARAIPQALVVCRLLSAKRYSFDELRVLLWIEGHPIPPQRVQASMQRLIEQARDELRRRGLARWRDTLRVAEHLAAQVLPSLSRTLLGRHIKHALSEPDVASYLAMVFQLLAGGLPAFASGDEYVTEDGEPLDKPLTQLIIDVYGLQRAQTDTLGEAKPWLPLDIAPTFIALARRRVFTFEYLLTTLQVASVHQFTQALIDRQTMFVEFPKMIRGVEAMFGDNVFGFGVFRALADWMPREDALGQALMIGSLLVIRRSGYDHALDQISAAIRPAAANYLRLQALLAALECELPEYMAEVAPVLAPSASSSGGDLQPVKEARESRIREIAQRHIDELRLFCERHPEFSDTSADNAQGAFPRRLLI